jgi:hypothetical protein
MEATSLWGWRGVIPLGGESPQVRINNSVQRVWELGVHLGAQRIEINLPFVGAMVLLQRLDSLTCAPQRAGVASGRFPPKGLFVLLAAACLLILRPFIAVAVWGLIISIAGCSGYCNLQKLLGGRGIGSERGHGARARNRLDGRQAR